MPPEAPVTKATEPGPNGDEEDIGPTLVGITPPSLRRWAPSTIGAAPFIIERMNQSLTSLAVPPVPDYPSAVQPPALVQARSLTRIWGKGGAAQVGIIEVDLDLRRSELLAIVGPSGSGKSTLGAILAGIDSPSSGSLVVDGTRVDNLKRDRLAQWRGANVGIVFQNFSLLPTLTAVENVELALALSGRRKNRSSVAQAALASVGMVEKARRLPGQLSGGEQQRVAIARAIVGRPALLVADEPTGNLDQANGHSVFGILTGLAASGTTIVFITHDLHLAAEADRVVTMIDGRVDAITDRTVR
jgi:putative ABC transport system ATP-binding protein